MRRNVHKRLAIYSGTSHKPLSGFLHLLCESLLRIRRLHSNILSSVNYMLLLSYHFEHLDTNFESKIPNGFNVNCLYSVLYLEPTVIATKASPSKFKRMMPSEIA